MILRLELSSHNWSTSANSIWGARLPLQSPPTRNYHITIENKNLTTIISYQQKSQVVNIRSTYPSYWPAGWCRSMYKLNPTTVGGNPLILSIAKYTFMLRHGPELKTTCSIYMLFSAVKFTNFISVAFAHVHVNVSSKPDVIFNLLWFQIQAPWSGSSGWVRITSSFVYPKINEMTQEFLCVHLDSTDHWWSTVLTVH